MFELFNRRAGGWIPTQNTLIGKVLIGIASVILICGIAASIAAPLIIAAIEGKTTSKNIFM